ncbi:MAG: hypothetical protein ACFFAU_10255 [Candidatus Hodarchaeota archaeon]
MTIYQAARIARYYPYYVFERDYIQTNRIVELINIALNLKQKYG